MAIYEWFNKLFGLRKQTDKSNDIVEEQYVNTDAHKENLEAKKTFAQLWEQMSEYDRNKIAGEDNSRTPEEEKALKEEALRVGMEIDRRNKIYNNADAVLKAQTGKDLNDIIFRLKTGVFVFVDVNVMSDKEWADLNDVLWDRDKVQFVKYGDKMRLTQVAGADRIKQMGVDYKIWHPNSSEEEKNEDMQNIRKRDDELRSEEMKMLGKPIQFTYHCKGFDLLTAEEAFEHFRGHLSKVKDYGDMCNGHCIHTWDDGKRILCRCSACGGLVLVQESEYHGTDSDDYYTDYFPVDTPEEAEQLNETYGGFDIETNWKGKKIFLTKGQVTGMW